MGVFLSTLFKDGLSLKIFFDLKLFFIFKFNNSDPIKCVLVSFHTDVQNYLR